ncbi:hypothetical protein HED51_06140 [Ochrobactrum grignonense]|nr:hypothetical protein [Brucella grignonensis]
MKAAPAASRNANERPKVRFRSPPLEAIADAVEKAVAKRTSEIEKNAEKRVKQAEKRAAEAMPRRVWYGPDKMRAAYLAGQGKSGEEIARIIGGTTAPRVRTMLHGHDIPLMRNGGHDDYCLLKWKRRIAS